MRAGAAAEAVRLSSPVSKARRMEVHSLRVARARHLALAGWLRDACLHAYRRLCAPGSDDVVPLRHPGDPRRVTSWSSRSPSTSTRFVGTHSTLAVSVRNESRASRHAAVQVDQPFSLEQNDLTLGGGDSANVVVHFDPATVGPVTGTWRLTPDDATPIVVTVTATAAPIPDCPSAAVCHERHFSLELGACTCSALATAPRATTRVSRQGAVSRENAAAPCPSAVMTTTCAPSMRAPRVTAPACTPQGSAPSSTRARRRSATRPAAVRACPSPMERRVVRRRAGWRASVSTARARPARSPAPMTSAPPSTSSLPRTRPACSRAQGRFAAGERAT